MPEKKKTTSTSQKSSAKKTKRVAAAKPAKATRRAKKATTKTQSATQKKTTRRTSKPAANTHSRTNTAAASNTSQQERTTAEPTPATTKQKKPWTIWQVLGISFALSLLITLGLLILTGVVIGGFAYKKVQQFSETAGVTIPELKETVQAGIEREPVQTDGRKNILILGTDQLATRGDAPVLTDTILLASVNFDAGSVTTLALPRDLWSDEYQTKINALYYFGEERYPETPEQFTTEVLSDWTGVPIHHTFVLSFATVSELIDTLGGVDVTVAESFTDEQFPHTDVDVTTERDPAKLYKTVSFTAGIEKMNGERALEYMRSRHSGGNTGTDISRSQRQAAVIMAVMQEVRKPEVLFSPTKAGQLYKFYLDNFSAVFPQEEVVATLKALLPHRDSLRIQSQRITIFPEDADGIIYHPRENERVNWIYRVRTSDTFASDIQALLFAPIASSSGQLDASESATLEPETP